MRKYHERRQLPYRPEQLFALVADIESYPQFLPWCIGARIRERQDDTIVADLVLGFKMIRERFTSHVALSHPDRIEVVYSEGPFRHLHNRWIFEASPEGGCIVDFSVDFELKSRFLQGMLDLVFGEAIHRMVGAFEARARALYGTAGSLPRAGS